MKRRFKRLLAFAFALTFLFGSAHAAVDARVTTDKLPVFNSPSYTQEELAGYLYEGETVSVVEVRGDWAKITRGGKTGYTGSMYLEKLESIDGKDYESRVEGYATRLVTVYQSPSTSSEALISLPWGTKVYVTGTRGDFCKVENASSTIQGYIPCEYLSRSEPSYSMGYATREVAIYAEASPSSRRLATLARGTAVRVIGVTGECCQVVNSEGTQTGYIYKGYLSHTPLEDSDSSTASALETLKANVEMVSWFDSARYVLTRGSYYTLYDIRNGQSIRIKYTTGSSHMDIEPATAEDTAKLKASLGGEWTWERTPFILIAEGKYIAASLYGEPHGGTDTISGNDMDGVVCLHLSGSRTHGSDRVDSGHQSAIEAAYNWAHS